MRKLIASGLAAALALTATPVASAQLSSSSSLFSSSSEAAPQQPQEPEHVQELEEALESSMNSLGQTRLAQSDRAAQSMLDDAYAGKVTWYSEPGSNVENMSTSAYRDLNHRYELMRFPHAGTNQVISNLQTIPGIDPGAYGPYGLAVGSDDNWVYIVLAEPTRI